MFDDVLLKPLHVGLVLVRRVVSAHGGQAKQGTLGSSHLLKVDESAATFGDAALGDLPILGALAPQASQHFLLRLAILAIMGDMKYRRREKGKVRGLWEGGWLHVEQWVGEGFFCSDSA